MERAGQSSIEGIIMTKRILLAGSTGLVGGLVSDRLSARSGIDLIRLVRQGSSAQGSAIDFEQLCAAPEATLRHHAHEGFDVAICCLGTTIRTAGSQAAMLRVDRDYVLADKGDVGWRTLLIYRLKETAKTR